MVAVAVAVAVAVIVTMMVVSKAIVDTGKSIVISREERTSWRTGKR